MDMPQQGTAADRVVAQAVWFHPIGEVARDGAVDEGSNSTVDERGARADRIDKAIGEVRSQARAEDRTMAIEVDAWGQITQIKLAPHSVSEGTERLEAEIVRQYKLARLAAETRAAQVYEAILREESKAAPAVRPDSEWVDSDSVQPSRVSSTLYS